MNQTRIAISQSSDKYVEEMYHKTMVRHQDLNTTGKELCLLGKEKTPTSKRKRMTETQPFEFETHKRAKFNEDLLQNDAMSEVDGQAQKSEAQG